MDRRQRDRDAGDRGLSLKLAKAAALVFLVAPALAAGGGAPAQGRVIESLPHVLPHRQRAEAVNRMLAERLDQLLPRLMRETGIDLWVVINREYAEDPVYLSLVPEPVFSARRTSMLIFHDRGPEAGVERLTVSRYPLSDLYAAAWEGGSLDEQWQRLGALIAERRPQTVGINTSRDWAFGDGLTAGLQQRLMEVLPQDLHGRVRSAEALCIRWLETRSPLELEAYPTIVALARGVISEAFSAKVITPGVTTTDDVAWFIRQRFEDLGLDTWFQPYVNLQRAGQPDSPESSFFGTAGVIMRGDVLHTDVGVHYLRLATDTQEMAYVLRSGETTAPAGLRRALATGNRWQDLLTGNFVTGSTGNAILAATKKAAQAEGISDSTYTHPLGMYGHGPGPIVGWWDNQGPSLPGEWTLASSTAFAIEGNIKAPIPEWDGQIVQIKLEQSAVFDGAGVTYLAGRQTEWHLVP